jgi:hypothetical protein
MGSMWALCGFMEKEDYNRFWRTSKAFDTFVVGGWNGGLFWRSVCCNVREEIVVKKCICICVEF